MGPPAQQPSHQQGVGARGKLRVLWWWWEPHQKGPRVKLCQDSSSNPLRNNLLENKAAPAPTHTHTHTHTHGAGGGGEPTRSDGHKGLFGSGWIS
jgi:hypothetical protein